MNYTAAFWLCLKVKQRGYGTLIGRLAQRSPSLEAGEIAIELQVDVPRALFQRPTLRAKVQIPDGAMPATIDATVVDNIATLLQEQLGFRVEVTAAHGDST